MSIRRQLRTAGITLVELLVVLAIGGVVLGGAITMMLSHIRTSSRSPPCYACKINAAECNF